MKTDLINLYIDDLSFVEKYFFKVSSNDLEIVNVIPLTIFIWILIIILLNFTKSFKHSSKFSFFIALILGGIFYNYLTAINSITYDKILSSKAYECLSYNSKYGQGNRQFTNGNIECIASMGIDKLKRNNNELNFIQSIIVANEDKLFPKEFNEKIENFSSDINFHNSLNTDIKYNKFFVLAIFLVISIISYILTITLFGEYKDEDTYLLDGTQVNPRTQQVAVIIFALSFIGYKLLLDDAIIKQKVLNYYIIHNYPNGLSETKLTKQEKTIKDIVSRLDKTAMEVKNEIINNHYRHVFVSLDEVSRNLTDEKINKEKLINFMKIDRKDDYFYYIYKANFFLNDRISFITKSSDKYSKYLKMSEEILIKKVNNGNESIIYDNEDFFKKEYIGSNINDFKTLLAINKLNYADDCISISNIIKLKEMLGRVINSELKTNIIDYSKKNNCYNKFNKI